MAEAIAKHYLKNWYIESAGTNPKPINPMAIKVMMEINIDLSNHYSKSITNKNIEFFDTVITLCGDAKDNCPNIKNLAMRHIHWDINDPANFKGTNNEKLGYFRSVRDQLVSKIKKISE